jgi:hypothetical protein
MARRIVNLKEKREEFDAAERRKSKGDEDVAEEEGEEEDGEEEEAEAEESPGDEEQDGEEEEAPKKKKKEPKPKAKPKARTRTPKVVRMKVVWVVFNNSNQRVATYEYPQRKQAEDHAAKLMTDKRTTHFVQPVKEPIEVKKEE